ncbi:Signal recognition particle receptor subunit beta [Hondaea fermentalgiana]|uniref:Signal recognition particle receptor subunit beta n=1 Tax=Hondaea fermentalgiana TaxID=2315210 RepID=A0A2R5FZM4_9STRA|nr:Signal recognition particle receptor subunit beta [Hondaea fermentalgiana]|eukprot:GBG24190.1 Signal recognition particle receptor subunit beta [Hondaea fermentalgiana]
METLRGAVPDALQTPLASAEAAVARQLGVSDDAALAILIAATLLAIVLATWAVTGGNSSGSAAGGRKRTGDAVVLLGNSGSGKTSLFYKLLTRHFAKMSRLADKCPECVTSMEIQEKRFPLVGANVDTPRRVIDFPGHARLRTQLPEVIVQARCLVFLVDAAAVKPKDIREISSLLYDVFVEIIRSGCEPRMLIVCNKCEASGAIAPEDLRKKLEKEIDGLKTTRHSIDTEGDDEMEIALGTEGVPFEFDSDAGCEVEFCSASVLEGGAKLDPVLDFIADAFPATSA